jgi:hypothetical protein
VELLKRIKFKYQNKQLLLISAGIFFKILFFIMLVYILSNFSDFWLSHKLEVVFIIFASIGFIYTTISGLNSKQLKKDIIVTKNSMLVGYNIRISKSALTIDVYKGNPGGFHLYDSKSSFTLFTFESDDLILHLLNDESISKQEFSLESLDYIRQSRYVLITKEKRRLDFDLKAGRFSITLDETKEVKTKKPRFFMLNPGFQEV